MQTETEDVARRLRDWLTTTRTSKLDLAKAADVSERLVYKVASGEGMVRRGSLARLANAMGVSVEWLETGQEGAGKADDGPKPMSVHEAAASYSAKRAVTLKEAIEAIAQQLGKDEDTVRKHVAKLITGEAET